MKHKRNRFWENNEDGEQEVVIQFQAGETDRSGGRILVASGTQSRNTDFWTGKHYRLVPAGMRTEYWEKNPLVFYMHHFLIPVATGSGLYVEDGKLWLPDDLKFHRKKVPIFGFSVGDFDTGVIADLWEERILNAVSIHIMLTREDLGNIIENDDEVIIPTSEVIEVSVVTVPGDREAGREQEYAHNLLDRMETEGMDREMAECVSCNYGIYGHTSPFPVQQGGDLGRQENSEQTANKGSFKNLAKLEVSMSKNQVEKTAQEAEEVEVEPTEVEITAQVEELEFEQEIELLVLDLADAIAQDDQALRTVAMALVKVPEFIQAISEAVGSQTSPHILEVTEAVPLRAKIVIVPGQRSETRQEQVAQPVNRPVAVQQAATAPVALPQQNGAGQKRKPGVLDLLPPSQ